MTRVLWEVSKPTQPLIHVVRHCFQITCVRKDLLSRRQVELLPSHPRHDNLTTQLTKLLYICDCKQHHLIESYRPPNFNHLRKYVSRDRVYEISRRRKKPPFKLSRHNRWFIHSWLLLRRRSNNMARQLARTAAHHFPRIQHHGCWSSPAMLLIPAAAADRRTVDHWFRQWAQYQHCQWRPWSYSDSE